MTIKQLNSEYAKVMLKAANAVGRKESVSLLRKAASIRKRIFDIEHEYPLIHNG